MTWKQGIQASVLGLFLLLIISCSGSRTLSEPDQPLAISSLKCIGEYDLPFNPVFKQTTIGGLSGIDYDPKRQVYYLISDDRSAITPARFYTASIRFSEQGIDSITFEQVHTLKAPNGNPYPNSKTDPAHTPDPEAIRYDRKRNRLVWSSEGERILREGGVVLEDPSVRMISLDGFFQDSLIMPEQMRMKNTENGPRQNGTFEGLTFADRYMSLYVSLEEPLYEDGPRADLVDNNAWIRILKFDLARGNNPVQYAYKLDPVAHPPIPADKFKINGIPDILWIGRDRFLVLERSFSTGNPACTIKVYLADTHAASNIASIPSLRVNPNFIPASKKLLLNMDSLGRYIDNIEGFCFGPDLPNGHRSLVFVSDNNFLPVQKTQFLVFEVIP